MGQESQRSDEGRGLGLCHGEAGEVELVPVAQRGVRQVAHAPGTRATGH